MKALAIEISGRDPKIDPQGIPYDLAGESCIPGIITDDYGLIFEEQTVVKSLYKLDNLNDVFCEEDMM